MVVDALVMALLAVGDVALMVHLRRLRGRRIRAERMMASLRLAIRREVAVQVITLPASRWKVTRAS